MRFHCASNFFVLNISTILILAPSSFQLDITMMHLRPKVRASLSLIRWSKFRCWTYNNTWSSCITTFIGYLIPCWHHTIMNILINKSSPNRQSLINSFGLPWSHFYTFISPYNSSWSRSVLLINNLYLRSILSNKLELLTLNSNPPLAESNQAYNKEN